MAAFMLESAQLTVKGIFFIHKPPITFIIWQFCGHFPVVRHYVGGLAKLFEYNQIQTPSMKKELVFACFERENVFVTTIDEV